MTDEPTHPGDKAIATALLLGVTFGGSEDQGFNARIPDSGHTLPLHYNKRYAAIRALNYMGFVVDDSGDVTLKG
jgi:hypothetical protein